MQRLALHLSASVYIRRNCERCVDCSADIHLTVEEWDAVAWRTTWLIYRHEEMNHWLMHQDWGCQEATHTHTHTPPVGFIGWLACNTHPGWWQIQKHFARGDDLINHGLTSDLSESIYTLPHIGPLICFPSLPFSLIRSPSVFLWMESNSLTEN